ncbi:dimethyladenosine transferase 2, mitochondrial isoform 2 [Mus musculus]|uniref:dimethyladenosine transferase 2, mitochondrial isoform 2 n=2 Tax=Mus musculus TaxID=10090 RepID=UPI0003D771AF|nr:dimethyladenosine transferase 2, mitochondrial isoform 2 [Mus musculus]|eukprot:XP_006496727.1 PREDICTED: dimethyladenosine transferase 2, mitochondrial isoform X1 [Mus musculus]
MRGPAMRLPPRIALSALARGPSCILGSGAATRKDWQTRNRRGFSDFNIEPLPDSDLEESSPWTSRNRSEPTRHIACKKAARNLVRDLLEHQNPSRQIILECNPGPGILTGALLKAGARVVAFESEKTFIPHLEPLQRNMDGELQVVHCDFFKMDPRYQEVVRPDVSSQAIFQNLGIKAVPWSAGVPIKVFGILPYKHERRILWKILFDLYSCESIYRYGRVELNMFVSEKEFRKLIATPKRPDLYQVMAVLWQVACDVKFLHMESVNLLKQNLYLVRMTPRRTLFTENLSPLNYDIFFHLVKHCFGKRNAPIIRHLRSLSTVDPINILRQIRKNPGDTAARMYPHDFKKLFETIEQSEDSVFKWIYDYCPEDMEF